MRAWIAARRKALVPAVATLASVLEGLITGGMSGDEALRSVSAAIVTALVYLLENDPLPPKAAHAAE